MKRYCCSITVVIFIILQIFIENCFGAALLGGHLNNGHSNQQTSNVEESNYFIENNDNQTEFQPYIPSDPLNNENSDDDEEFAASSIEETNDDNLNEFPNHRISYGPLHQPKTYIQTKYAYPLISSSYASMKIQGNNKNKIVNGDKNRIIQTHRFPQNDISLVDLFPDYKRETSTTSTTTTTPRPTKVTTRRTTTRVPTSTTTVAPSTTVTIAPRTTSTTRRPTTTTTTTTTPIPITTSAPVKTTQSPEEADSIFNKFLMEIFQTTDFDNEKKVEETEITTEKFENVDEHLYSMDKLENDFESNNYQYNNVNQTNEMLLPIKNDKYENLPPTTNYTHDEFVYVEYDDKTNPMSSNYTYDYYIDDYEKAPQVNLTSNLAVNNKTSNQIELTNVSNQTMNIVTPNNSTQKPKPNKNQAINVFIVNNGTNNNRSPIEIAIESNESINTERNMLVELLSNENYRVNKTTVTPSAKITTTPSYDKSENYTLSVSLMPPKQNPQNYESSTQTNSFHAMKPSPFVMAPEQHEPQTPNGQQTQNEQQIPNDTFDFPMRPLKNSYLVPPSAPGHVENVPPPMASPLIAENKLNQVYNQTTDSYYPQQQAPQRSKIETDKILSLNSQPMYHQLPTDLTPPLEERPLRNPAAYSRPQTWPPVPHTSLGGHYHMNKESSGSPSAPSHVKRIPDDNLPNILPQFRPNAKISYNHPPENIGTIHHKHLIRRPPPSGSSYEHVSYVRPVNNNYFDKLPPRQQGPAMVVHAESKQDTMPTKPLWGYPQDFSHSPPKVPERHLIKKGVDNEVSTLQMIKSSLHHHLPPNITNEEVKSLPPQAPILKDTEENPEQHAPSGTDFPLYVVYPTNHSALNFNIFNNDKSTVVIGKRGEKPIPPPLITETEQGFENLPSEYIHNKPTDYPILSDFPYPIERPNGTVAFKYVSPGEKYGHTSDKLGYNSVSTSIIPALNSGVVLGIGKEVPAEEHIAIAYSPTEPSPAALGAVVYPMPAPGQKIDNTHVKMNVVDMGHFKTGNEFTVSAVMHTHSQNDRNIRPQNEVSVMPQNDVPRYPVPSQDTVYRNEIKNHKIDLDVDRVHQPMQLDFQAPFQASVNLDSQQEHWSVVKNKNDRIDEDLSSNSEEGETVPGLSLQREESSSPETVRKEFDFENFKPQLFGGFKPIIKAPTENSTSTI